MLDRKVYDVDKCKVSKFGEVVDQRGESFERGMAIIQGKIFDLWLAILDELVIVEVYCS